MNIKILTPILRILALFSILITLFSIPVYADPFSGSLSFSPSSVAVGYSGTYSASMEPTSIPPGGFFVTNAIIPAGYEFIQPASGNLIASYTMYNKVLAKNQVIINIFSNNPATSKVNVQYSLDNGVSYTTANNLDRANMVIGATNLKFTPPTATIPGSIDITLGGTAGPVTTDHVVSIVLADGVLRSPVTPGPYIWIFEAKNSPGGTSYIKSAVATVYTITSLVRNPGFESGTTDWNPWGVSFATGTPASEGIKSANIGISTVSSNMQLHQYGITLEPYTRYRLTFAAFSNTGHDMSVKLFKHGSPYTNYGLDPNYDLTTAWEEFSTEFTTTGFSSTVNDARLMFWFVPFGTSGDRYYIDSVRLVKVVEETGTLSIFTTPVSGQIYVDGVLKGTGSWTGSVSVGIHTVSFGSFAGYIIPSPQVVTVTAGGTSSVTGTYIIEPIGILSVATTPVSGQIYVDGLLKGTGSWTGLVSVGSHTVSFGPFTGYSTPAPQAVAVTLGGTSSVTGTYIPISSILNNSGFESGTASWNNWGITFTAAPPASEGINSVNIVTQGGSNMQLYQYGITLEPNTRYRLAFAAYSNTGHDLNANLLKHGSPYTFYGLNKNFDLTTGWKEFSTDFTTTGFSSKVYDARLMFQFGSFAGAGEKYYIDNVRLVNIDIIETGTLSVATTPVSGQIYVDGLLKGTGSWTGSVSVGGHTVSFGPFTGYLAPAPQAVAVTLGGTSSVTGVYIIEPTGTLSVATTPVSGQIYVDGLLKGTGSWTGLVSVGSHTVSFGPFTGYSTPAPQAVAVTLGGTSSVTGTYTPVSSILSNPGFESGTVSWNNWGVTFTTGLPAFEGSNSANLVTQGGSNMQLYQYGITLEPYTSYRLTFAAYSNAGHDFTANIFKHVSPYTGYGLNQRYDLTTGWNEFSTDFTTTDFSSTVNDARLMFQLGSFAAAGEKYYIDNVRLEKIVVPPP